MLFASLDRWRFTKDSADSKWKGDDGAALGEKSAQRIDGENRDRNVERKAQSRRKEKNGETRNRIGGYQLEGSQPAGRRFGWSLGEQDDAG